MKSKFNVCLRLFFLLFLSLIISANLYAQRCQATTKKGAQCKRNAQSGSVYCWQHKGMYGESSKSVTATPDNLKSATKENIQPNTQKSESSQCQAITKKGKRCSRKAKAGSNYCWQHLK